MKITTKGKFAVTALLDLMLYNSNGLTPVNLQSIGQRQGISISYLEQLFHKLKRLGMVKSYKGPGGGYLLAKDPKELTIAQIFKSVEENIDARSCKGLENCKNNTKCLTHDLWHDLTKHIYSYLDNVTLNDLIKLSRSNKIELFNKH